MNFQFLQRLGQRFNKQQIELDLLMSDIKNTKPFPQIGSKFFSILVCSFIDTEQGIEETLSLCRMHTSNIGIKLKALPKREALDTLRKERDALESEDEKVQTSSKTDGKKTQDTNEIHTKYGSIEQHEAMVRKNDILYEVSILMICYGKNTVTLRKKAKDITDDLWVAGLEVFTPANQVELMKDLLMFNDSSISALNVNHLPGSEFARIVETLLRKSQMYNNSNGIPIGFGDFDDVIFLDLEDMPSKGIGEIIGPTGWGKTYGIGLLSILLYLKGYAIEIIDPKGKGTAELTLTEMIGRMGATSHILNFSDRELGFNIFDMFEDTELQQDFELTALKDILLRGIKGKEIAIIGEILDELRENKGIQLTLDTLKAALERKMNEIKISGIPSHDGEVSTDKQRYQNIIDLLEPWLDKKRRPWFTNETTVAMKNGADVLLFDFSGVKDLSKKTLINLTLLRRKFLMGVKPMRPTFFFVDELHEVLEKGEEEGYNTSISIIRDFANEGRAFGTIFVGAGQSQLLIQESEAGEALKVNASWRLFIGPQDEDVLKKLHVSDEDIQYLEDLTEDQKGHALLVVQGRPTIRVTITAPAFIHKLLVGNLDSRYMPRIEDDLEEVLRPEDFTVKEIKDILAMGYVLVHHKELSGEYQDFLILPAMDHDQFIDQYLVAELIKKSKICKAEIKEMDYEKGIIIIADPSSESTQSIFIPPKERLVSKKEITHIVNELDKTGEWLMLSDTPLLDEEVIVKRTVRRAEIRNHLKDMRTD